MKNINYFTTLVILGFLTGCGLLDSSLTPKTLDGGSITISHANPQNPEESTVITVKQPENPNGSANVTIEKDQKTGNIVVKADTGKSQNAASLQELGATINMLNPVIYVGTGMIILGALMGLFFRQIYWAICISGVGVCMIIGSFLLAKYSMFFLFGLAVFLGYIAWLLYRKSTAEKAIEENVAVTEKIKEYLDPESKKEIFDGKNSIANLTQSDSTKKIVDEVQKKLEIK